MKLEQNSSKCIGIIMDGNRRWARERGLPTLEGHRQGYEKLQEVVRWAREAGVGTLIFYAFSTENWKRTEEEVAYLMNLFETALQSELDKVKKENARVKFIGERKRLSEKIQKLMDETEEKTKNNDAITVVLAISYGGHAEIVHAIRSILGESASESPQKSIDENFVNARLWTAGLPDPDIIIRTGGEKRLSNFLTWQSVYSELFFTDTHWPDFSKEEFQKILGEYAERDRRRGK